LLLRLFSIPMLFEEVKKLKVIELKTELQKRSLPTTGNKAELQTRLEDYLTHHVETTTAEDDPDADVAPPGFSSGKEAIIAPPVALKPLPVASPPPTSISHAERVKARAAKFNMASPHDPHTLELLRKRQERFGTLTKESERLLQENEERAKKQKRAERFGFISQEDLMRKRAERFDI
jgi:hypothetical protein